MSEFKMNDNASKMLRELELDEKLASDAQLAMRNVVKALPADELSMSWRSGLNERLVAAAGRQRRQRILGWVVKPAFGLAVAGALAFVVVMRQVPDSQPTVGPTSNAIEASMVATHRDAAEYSDLVGVGLLPVEAANDRTNGAPERSDWNEVDVDTL